MEAIVIEDIAAVRRHDGIDFQDLETDICQLREGDIVKLSFRITEYSSPGLAECCRAAGKPCPVGESMWVQVTAIEGTWPDLLFRGELVNKPFFIDPAKLRYGQPIEFQPCHILRIHERES